MNPAVDFSTFAKWLQENWKLAIAAVAPASLCKLAGFAPPWPDAGGLAGCAVAVLASLIGVVIGFALSGTKLNTRYALLIAAAGAAGCLGVYFAFWSLFVDSFAQASGSNHDLVRTVFVKGGAFKVATDHMDEKQVLQLFGYRMDEVYTPASLLLSRLGLLASFAGTFFFLTVSLGFAPFMGGASSQGSRAARQGR